MPFSLLGRRGLAIGMIFLVEHLVACSIPGRVECLWDFFDVSGGGFGDGGFGGEGEGIRDLPPFGLA